MSSYILGRLRFPDDNESDTRATMKYCCPFHFVVYYNDNEEESRKNTRNDNVSTQKFRSPTRCHSEILTSLLSKNVPIYQCPMLGCLQMI